MKTSKRRGFTIVELVIVIAVIAILAGVLIPTFSSIVKKANEASDTTLIKSLNTSLKAAEAIDGAKPATMHDALEATKADGYDVSKIKATASGNQILWDSVNNCFAYLKDGAITYIPESNTTTVEKHQLWSIAQVGETLSTTYSNYLAEGYTATELEVTTGIDVGSNAIASIKYTGGSTAKSVVIRTNGGALTINAEHDTVRHFGGASIVTVTAIAGESYHEHGTVNDIKLGKGRVVVESQGNVGSVLIIADSLDNVKVEAKSGSTIGGVGATNSTVAGQLQTSDNIKDVAKESIVTTVPTEGFAGGLGTEAAPYLISTREQWTTLANLCKASKGESGEVLKGQYTAANTDGKYFKVINDLDFAGYEDRVQLSYFCGNLDFGGNKVQNVTIGDKQFPEIYEINDRSAPQKVYSYPLIHMVIGTCTIQNLADFNVYSSDTDILVRLIQEASDQDHGDTGDTVTLKDITISGSVILTDNNTGLFIKYGQTTNIVLENCTNRANITNNGLTAAFIGRTSGPDNKNITFRNCVNRGTLITTSSSDNQAAMLISNGNSATANVVIENCVNYGNIFSSGDINNHVCAGADKYTYSNSIVNRGQIKKVVASQITVDSNNKFIVATMEGATIYRMVFSFSGAADKGGVASVTFNLTASELHSVDAYGWKFNTETSSISGCQTADKYGTTVKTTTENGTTYYVADTYNSTKNITVTVYGLTDGEEIVGYATYKY